MFNFFALLKDPVLARFSKIVILDLRKLSWRTLSSRLAGLRELQSGLGYRERLYLTPHKTNKNCDHFRQMYSLKSHFILAPCISHSTVLCMEHRAIIFPIDKFGG